MGNSITVKVTMDFTLDDIENWIVTAFEGGIGYWSRIVFLKGTPRDKYHKRIASILVDGSNNSAKMFGIIDTEGCKRYWVTRGKFLEGLQTMSAKYCRHWANLLTDYDAETADVLIQCVIFGEIVYGYAGNRKIKRSRA